MATSILDDVIAQRAHDYIVWQSARIEALSAERATFLRRYIEMITYLNLLGIKVRDCVTGVEGIVTSVAFDLYGCVQALINRGLDKDGNPRDMTWFDCNRLIPISNDPVMEQPFFVTENNMKEIGGSKEKGGNDLGVVHDGRLRT